MFMYLSTQKIFKIFYVSNVASRKIFKWSRWFPLKMWQIVQQRFIEPYHGLYFYDWLSCYLLHVYPICSWCLSHHILSSENISFLSRISCLVDYMFCFAFLMLLWASNIHAHSLQQMVTQISICCKLSAIVHFSFCPPLA